MIEGCLQTTALEAAAVVVLMVILMEMWSLVLIKRLALSYVTILTIVQTHCVLIQVATTATGIRRFVWKVET